MSLKDNPEKLNPDFAHKLPDGVLKTWQDICLVCGKTASAHFGSTGEFFCNWTEQYEYKKSHKPQPEKPENETCKCSTGSDYGPHSHDGKVLFIITESSVLDLDSAFGACANHAHFYLKHGGKVTPILSPNEPVPQNYSEYKHMRYRQNFGMTGNTIPAYDVICNLCGKKWEEHWDACCSSEEKLAIENFYGENYKNYKSTKDIPATKPEKPTRTKPITSARTQKAKGLAVLKSDYTRNTVPYDLIDADKAESSDLINRFVRPCPMRPRHGFVDSRFIENDEQAQTIIKETLAADAEAEFILARKIDAEFSGIWTKGYLTIGKGNDGATAGHSAKMIPVLGELTSDNLNKKANVEHAPYLELLFKYKNYVSMQSDAWEFFEVQLRDGPELPTLASDYIPSEVTVTNVVLAEGDLLEWETKVTTFPQGTVVYHPNGSMASHYAIHAVLAKIPVLITREPKIGEVLKPIQSQNLEPKLRDIMAGYSFGVSGEMTMHDAAFAMLAGLHHTSVWLGRHDILLGLAIGCAWRLTVTAGLGEARHVLPKHGRRRHKLNRDTVYSRVWNCTDKPAIRRKFRTAVQGFLTRDYDDGFGGESWYRFTQWAVKMHNALLAGNIKASLNYLNQLVHSAHNNGWGFDKFVSQDQLSATANNPIYAAVRCAVTLYRADSMDIPTRKIMADSFTRYRRPLADTDIISGGKRISQSGHLIDEDSDEDNEDSESDFEPIPNLSELPVTVAQVKHYDSGKNKFYLHVQIGHKDTEHYQKYDLSVKWTLEQFQNLVQTCKTAKSLSGAPTDYFVIPENETHRYWLDYLLIYDADMSIPELQSNAKNIAVKSSIEGTV